MQRERRSTQTTQEALDWFNAFHQENSRMPSWGEISERRGPTWRLIKRLGGLPGIAGELGLERRALPPRISYPNEKLVASLANWTARQPADKTPSSKALTRDFYAGDPVIAPFVAFQNRFGTWDSALEQTGQFRFSWNPSDCVSTARQAKLTHPGLNITKAIQTHAVRGKNPTLRDFGEYYPSIKTLSRERMSWDGWDSRNTKTQTRNNTLSTISYGVLAMTVAGGDLAEFEAATTHLHEQSRGPAFSKQLFAKIAPNPVSESAGYVFALDTIERTHDTVLGGPGRAKPPIDALGIGDISMSELVLPTFMPEIDELTRAS